MANTPLEFLATKFDNVVRYGFDGTPQVFVKIPAMLSIELGSDLPLRQHPAFIINGATKDYILLGKYKAAKIGEQEALYGLPAMPPAFNMRPDDMLAGMRAGGSGASGMTIADYGLITCLAAKLGYSEQHGNNSHGFDYRDCTAWRPGQSISLNDKHGFRGYLYECIRAHTSSADLLPSERPDYWKKLKYIGAIMMPEEYTETNRYTGNHSLNGTGPASWYFGGDISSIADICGNVLEYQYGYRVVKGEIQILENNNAASPNADLSESSSAWKAIKPESGLTGHTLVAPGTAGTLHWNKVGGNLVLDVNSSGMVDGQSYTRAFKDLTVNSTNLPNGAPAIMKELGLFPLTGSNIEGTVKVDYSTTEMLAARGRHFEQTTAGGLGRTATFTRDSISSSYGCRARWID